MSKLKFEFTKWQGCGNDFVMIDGFAEKIVEADYAALARAACDRHYGIGADGIILLLPSDVADIRMRIINADGSEAEMCGNGIRCFAALARELGRVDKDEFTVETGAGILVPRLEALVDGEAQIRVDMGEPILEGEKIPVTGFGMNRVISEKLHVKDKVFNMTCVSMGNPHAVVFVDDAENFPIYEYGPLCEKHEAFPRKTNTEFVQVLDREHVRMRVWERGASVTLACGTGSCATLVAGVLNGRTERKAQIQLDGGNLIVEWADNNHVFMTGPAKQVFAGVYEVNL